MRVNDRLQTALAALVLTLLLAGGAMAQVAGAGGDVLGATPIEAAFIAFLKIAALGGIAWGFARLMSGRHTVEGLVCMAVGALGIAKVDAIASLMGL